MTREAGRLWASCEEHGRALGELHAFAAYLSSSDSPLFFNTVTSSFWCGFEAA